MSRTQVAYYTKAFTIPPNSTVSEYMVGDFVDIISFTGDITKIYISFNDGEFVEIDRALPCTTLFTKISLMNASSSEAKVILLVGREYFKGLVTRSDVVIMSSKAILETKLVDTTIALPIDIQYRRKEAFTLYSGTVTASGNSADIDVSNYSGMEIQLKITGVSGTNPSLSVYIEGKFDTVGDYKPLVWEEGISAVNIWRFTITQLIFKTIRVRWVVSGTSPSFTFRVDAVAIV